MCTRFYFSDASVCVPDCGRNVGVLSERNNVNVSPDSCWHLLKVCLHKLPIKKVYDVLDELYASHQLCFAEGNEFVVESIRGRSVNKGVYYCLVKWAGWPPVFNTWEPESNLKGCEEAIQAFINANGSPIGILPVEAQPDKNVQVTEVLERLQEAVDYSSIRPVDLLERFMDMVPSADTPRPYKPPQYLNLETKLSRKSGTEMQAVALNPNESKGITFRRARLIQKVRQNLESALRIFEQKLNAVYTNEAPITVENKVDSECPPVDFQPIPDYLPGKDVFLPTKSPVGCECSVADIPEKDSADGKIVNMSKLEPCWENRRKGCCAVRAGTMPPYNKYKRLVAPPGHPVYECNSACPCGPSCPFRVVQLGRTVPLCVFRTRDRGWGVKTKIPIGKGTFVAEYLGEILTFEEAENRGLIYDKQTMTYLFDLDFEGDAHYTVDASQVGNISHFINHSCDPNLTVRCVFIECLNTKLPRIALYASRFIKKDEELTFDYNMTGAVTGPEEPDGIHSDLQNTDGVRKSPTRSSSSTELTQDTSSEVSFDSKSASSKSLRMKCLCRSKNCRGYLVS
ncbi:unnamed protein product [Calicophoron daubneyi]|uniref:Histone-lysine N-methyltransferase n=1 Tax=Calicophoron daubneyi TaxID=300641 RepID=A0AAV2TGV5_CALDB